MCGFGLPPPPLSLRNGAQCNRFWSKVKNQFNISRFLINNVGVLPAKLIIIFLYCISLLAEDEFCCRSKCHRERLWRVLRQVNHTILIKIRISNQSKILNLALRLVCNKTGQKTVRLVTSLPRIRTDMLKTIIINWALKAPQGYYIHSALLLSANSYHPKEPSIAHGRKRVSKNEKLSSRF